MHFTFEVFAQDLTILGDGDQAGAASSLYKRPLALAFQFLDYPLLIVYASTADAAWGGGVVGGRDASPWQPHLAFGSGKACVLEADAGELSYLVEQVPLYVSMLDTSTLPRPQLLASGSTPLLITPPAQHPQHAPGGPMLHAALRSVTLLTPSGQPAAVARVSCRLSQYYGDRAPPFAPPGPTPNPQAPPTAPPMPRPHTAPGPPVNINLTAAQQHAYLKGEASGMPAKPPPLYFANDSQPKQAWAHNSASFEAMPQAEGAAQDSWSIPAWQPAVAAVPAEQGQQQQPAGQPYMMYRMYSDAERYSMGQGAQTDGSAGMWASARSTGPLGQHNQQQHQQQGQQQGQHQQHQQQGQQQQGSGVRDSLEEFSRVEMAAQAALKTAAQDKAVLQLAALLAAGAGQVAGNQPRAGQGNTAPRKQQGATQAKVLQGRRSAMTSPPRQSVRSPARTRATPARPSTAGPTASAAAAAATGTRPATAKPAGRTGGAAELPLLRALLKHAGAGDAAAQQRRRSGPVLGKGLNTAIRAAERAGLSPEKIAPLSLAKGLPYRRSRSPSPPGQPPRGPHSPRKRAGKAGPASAEGASVDPQSQQQQEGQETGAPMVPTDAVKAAGGMAMHPPTLLQQVQQAIPSMPAQQLWDSAMAAKEAAATAPKAPVGKAGKPAHLTWGENTTAPPQQLPSRGPHGGLGAGLGYPAHAQPPAPTPQAHPHGTPMHAPHGVSPEALRAMESGMVGNHAFSNGYSYGQHPAAGGFQMSSIVMWEVMSLVCMRSVLSSAIGTMHTSMAGMAQQLIANSFAPMFSLGAQQQAAAAGLSALQAQMSGQAATGHVPLGTTTGVSPFMPMAFGSMQQGMAGSGGGMQGLFGTQGGLPSQAMDTAQTLQPAGSSFQSRPSSEEGAVLAHHKPALFQRAPTIAVRVGGPQTAATLAAANAFPGPISPRAASSPKMQRPPPVSFSSASHVPLSPVESSIDEEDNNSGRQGSGSTKSVRSEEVPESYSADFSQGGSPRSPRVAETGAKPAPAAPGGWTRSSTFFRPALAAAAVHQSISASEMSYEQDFEDAHSPPTQRRPQTKADGTRIIPAWEEDIPEEDAVEEVDIRQESRPALSRMSSANTAMLLADTDESSSVSSRGVTTASGSSDPRNRSRPATPLGGYSPRGAVAGKPSAIKAQPITAASRKSIGGRTRRTEKGASGSSSSSGSSAISSQSSGGGLQLSQLSPGQKKAVGFRDAFGPNGSSGSASSGSEPKAGDNKPKQRARSIAMSEVSFFSSVASSFDEDEEDDHTRSEELDTVRSLHRPVAPLGKATAARKSRTGSMGRGGRRESTASGETSMQSDDISWGEDSDGLSDTESINIVTGDVSRKGLQERMSVPPPPRRLNSAQRDSSKSFMITASDLSSDEGSIEFDAEELASGLDDYEAANQLLAKRRSHMGGTREQPSRPKTSLGWHGGRKQQQADSYDDLGETADIMEEISNLSSQY